MKKKITSLFICCICAAMCTFTAAADNRVSKMEIEVALRADGSAYITQEWTADTDTGTEFYLACHDSGYLTITDFSVSDKNGSYTFDEDWNVNATFDEKANKCGIVKTEKGVELCWGISEYGQNRYAIEYVLHDLVGSYSDADGFNHRFVDEMSTFPTDVVLTIRDQDGTPLTDDICDIWGFGFDGQIQFEDGVIRAWSESPLESGQNITVMVSLKKGVLSPLRTVEESFETLKERAFEGSDYGPDSAQDSAEDEELTGGDILIVTLFFAFIAALVAAVAVIGVKLRKAKLNRQMKSVQYFRDAPNNGNLNVTYELGRNCGLCSDDSLLGAYLLRLISDGSLEPEGESDDPKLIKLQLVRPPRSDDQYDDVLYTVLEAAAGADGVLHPNELEQYCDRNIKPLSRFLGSCIKEAKQILIRTGCLKSTVCNGTKDLTQEGKNQLNEILGLKRFLLDFSLIHERGVKETVIWQDYMIYALLLGIADKVAPQIRKLYPDALPQIERFERCARYARYYNGIMFTAYQNDRYLHQPSRSSGSGGRASFGGGGGFSGGGGGGTR